MEDNEAAAKMLRQPNDIGVAVSIDHFGTGYSSLAFLKRFPIDELKIDRSSIKQVPDNADDAAMVKAVIAMKNLGRGLREADTPSRGTMPRSAPEERS